MVCGTCPSFIYSRSQFTHESLTFNHNTALNRSNAFAQPTAICNTLTAHICLPEASLIKGVTILVFWSFLSCHHQRTRSGDLPFRVARTTDPIRAGCTYIPEKMAGQIWRNAGLLLVGCCWRLSQSLTCTTAPQMRQKRRT